MAELSGSSQRPGTGSGFSQREFYRRGPDHQQLLGGVIPDFLTIRQLFGFRSVDIGRWVSNKEQEKAAALFFDALCDLSQLLMGPGYATPKVLKIRRQLISLRSTLGLQYGTGGRPGVAAHYSPLQRNFALAKNAGPGSIAHEWFHAFDHYVADKLFVDQSLAAGPRFASRLWVEDAETLEHPLNQRLQACYQAILVSDDGSGPSALFQHSVAADKASRSLYYSQPEEVCARAFEAFIQDGSIKNNFLVVGSKQSSEAKLGLYPQGQQRLRINAAFAHYFSGLCQALAASRE